MQAPPSVEPGACPVCRGPGPIGGPCASGAHPERPACCVPVAHLPPLDAPSDPHVGRVWGDLLIARKLGEGGIGAVYLALQGPLQRPVAIKLLLAGSTTVHGFGGRRFRIEAEALARLRHPNIVQLLAFSAHEGQPYMVMEYVDGGRTLQAVMRSPAFDLRAAHAVLAQLVDAAEAMHAAGVVHRDIKPSNVMIQSRPGDPWRVRLVDFGLAKMLEHGAMTEHLSGTLRYMAPEQLTTRRIGPWTDYYALGVLAAELLTGQHPFPPHRPRPLVERRLDPALDPVAELGVAVPDATAAFLRAALAWDPAARLCDAAGFRAGLEAAFGPLLEHDVLPTRVHRAEDAPVVVEAADEPARGLSRGATVAVLVAAMAAGGSVGWWALGPDKRSDGIEAVGARVASDAMVDDAATAPDPIETVVVQPLDGTEVWDAGSPDAIEVIEIEPDAAPPDAAPPDAEAAAEPDRARRPARRVAPRRRPAPARAPAARPAAPDAGELMHRF